MWWCGTIQYDTHKMCEEEEGKVEKDNGEESKKEKQN